ncbi:extracellular matrix organizing protein FRAS1-like isoform X3 [Centruroides vittatus]|uniref:extracellular matrix organizing protein FRAS1-like isoform X3 n=1 Tax=Centruroides vittatus TaxID=120091 RepID=UPI00350EF1BF
MWTRCLLVLCLWAARAHRRDPGICRYGHLYFREGAVWDLDACRTCSCHRSRPVCRRTRCRDPLCDFSQGEVLRISADRCCPECLGPGNFCLSQGKVIPDSSRWKKSECENCRCRNGTVVCESVRCPVGNCLPGQILSRRPDDCCRKCLPLEKSCIYDNILYENGEIWSTTNCSKCQCREGVVICFIAECPATVCKEEQSLEFLPSECCPICVNKHCDDGISIRKDGEIWNQDPCTACVCQVGHIVCHIQECPPNLPCKNGQILRQINDDCCPSCVSSEEHCSFGNKTYYNGNLWYNNDCEYCACNKGSIECKKAVCEISTCSEGKKLIHQKGKCCPECVTDFDVCVIGDKWYKDGDTWSYGKCGLCSCKKGRILCFHYDCTRCINNNTTTVINFEECCPNCQKGVCLPPCKKCEINGYRMCSACLNDKHVIFEGQCQEKCPEGYFIDYHGVCQICHQNCKECFGREENQCLLCYNNRLLKHGSCVENCGESYFVFNRSCEECHTSCSSCLGPNKNQCVSCKNNKVLQNGQCIEDCFEFHLVNNECLACHPACKECRDSQPTSCTKCTYNQFLLKSVCVDVCGQGFYENVLERSCSACHPTCRFCANGPTPDLCLSCNHGYLLPHPENEFGYCVEECPSNHYVSPAGVCKACHNSCFECDGPESMDCIKCNKDFNMKDGECVKTCGSGYFANNGVCLQCHVSCKTCYGAGIDECVSCPENVKLSFGSCSSKCTPGKYLDSDGNCKDCHPSCSSCILHFEKLQSICMLCKEPSYFSLGESCVKDCGIQFFQNNFGRCEACHHSCLSCNAKSTRSCTSCKEGKVLTHNGRCVDYCYEGYFEVNGECLACDINCIQCSYDGECQMCRDDLVLQFGECVSSCYEDYYLDYGTRECKECSVSCGKCQGPTPHDCISCLGNLLLEEGTCVISCKEGFYQDGKDCKVCSKNCRTCTNYLNCTSCHSPLSLLDNECVSNCGIQKYPDRNNQICKECSENCYSCFDFHHCNYCKEGFYLKHKICVRSCGTSYFIDEELRSCELNEKAPVLLVNDILVGEFNSYRVVESTILSAIDDDTNQNYLNVILITEPTTGKLILQSDNGNETILRTGSTFFYTAILNKQLLFKHTKQEPLAGNFSIMINDRQLNSNIEEILIKIVSPYPPVIEQIEIPVIEKGKEQIISNRFLIITDEDNLKDIVINILEGPHYGKLVKFPSYEKVSKLSIKDLENNNLIYQHDGSYSDTDMMVLQVWDGYNTRLGTFYFQVFYQISNESNLPDQLENHTLNTEISSSNDEMWTATIAPINLGISILNDFNHIITDSELNFQIEDVKPENILYVISSHLKEGEGRIEHMDHPGKMLTNFTQADINNGNIIYKTSKKTLNEENNFYFKFLVFNKDNPKNIPVYPEQQFFIYMKMSNNKSLAFIYPDSEIVVALNSNTAIPIEKHLFTVTYSGDRTDKLTLTLAKAPSHGFFLQGIGQIIEEGHNFSYVQALNESFYYMPGSNSNLEDKIVLSISDGKCSTATTLRIKFIEIYKNGLIAVNSTDQPITIQEGDSVVIYRDHVAYLDHNSDDSKILFTLISEPIYGDVELMLLDNKYVKIKADEQFTQEDINYMIVRYTSNKEIGMQPVKDKIYLKVSNLRGDFQYTELVLIILPLNTEAPIITVVGEIEVEESKMVIVGPDIFTVIDEDTSATDLTIIIDVQPKYGYLENQKRFSDSEKSFIGLPISSFILQDLYDLYIQYIQNDHLNIEPVADSFLFHVTDGRQSSSISRVNITIHLINDEPPIIVKQQLFVEPGQIAVIDNSTLLAYDRDTPVTDLIFILEIPPKYGKLKKLKSVAKQNLQHSIDLTSGNKFSVQDIMNELVIYINDGNVKNKEDSFILTVSDGEFYDTQAITILIELLDDNIPKLNINGFGHSAVTIIQLERSEYSIEEPNEQEHITKLSVTAMRSGDVNHISKVRVNTKDGTAISGIDYQAKSSILFFDYGETKKTFEVEIIYNKDKGWNKNFFITLCSEESLNAILGNISISTIFIVDNEDFGTLVLPAPPVLISLQHYDDIEINMNKDSSPGYPLICVTPCDPHYPNYKTSHSLCKKSGINEADIYFSWEASIPTEVDGFHSRFETIRDSTPFTSVHHKILDTIYFGPKFMIRCIAQPLSSEGSYGIALKSNVAKIGSQNGICKLKSQSFKATLQYLNSSNIQHPNRLHIHIEIPHQDGMLPLISTYPLHNVNYLLTESIYRQQHLCSNLVVSSKIKSETGETNYGFLNPFDISNRNFSEFYFTKPYQYGLMLREEKTLRLYQHLDLKTCLWKFDAWYHMTELVDLCGGNIASNFQLRTSGETYLTVHLPLYVSYIYAAAPTGWITMEHHTELEFSFSYNTMLWKTGVETDGFYHSTLQILKVVITKNGALTIKFKTQAKFRGLFILEHPVISDLKSQVKPPENLTIAFNLELLWTEQTFDGPTQLWKTTSKYNLKDYTGLYIIELIPCTVQSTQSYSPNFLEICTAHLPEKFEIPVMFQQTNRPVPVVYTLNTIFQLVNDEKTFMLNPYSSSTNLYELDYKGIFFRGQTVYGRVLWNPNQDLKSAYSLRIEKLFICAGRDGFVPFYDPTGEEYDRGPGFGCIQNSRRLQHRFLLLDRSDPLGVDKSFLDVPFGASFADQNDSFYSMKDIPGLDGFLFKVDALYRVDSGRRWYLQVVYSIGSARRRHRKARQTETRTGTNMRILRLAPDPSPPASGWTAFPWLGAPLSALLLPLAVWAYLRRRALTGRRPTDKCPEEGEGDGFLTGGPSAGTSGLGRRPSGTEV